MPALGWLLNLGFAGGGAPPAVVPTLTRSITLDVTTADADFVIDATRTGSGTFDATTAPTTTIGA